MFAAKAAPATVEEQARGLAEALLGSYPVPLAPRSAPDLARVAKLYAENCSMCHGATGAGNGPGAAGLDPPPIAFTDAARARERSLFALYQVFSSGLAGTSLARFADLPAGVRLPLSFYVVILSFP